MCTMVTVIRAVVITGSTALINYIDLIYYNMWHSRVEIEHYSIAYFERIAAFEAL